MRDSGRRSGPSADLPEVLSLALRALRQPQAGLAGILSVTVAKAEASLAALYLVPPSSQPAELLASGGRDASSLGPPGPAAEGTLPYLRQQGLGVSPSTGEGSPDLPVPWNQYPYLGTASALLPGDQRAVLLMAGRNPIPGDLLQTVVGPLGLLAGILSSARREDSLLREAHQIRQEGTLLAAGLQHDLRTPLTSILGCAQTLQEQRGPLSEERRAELLRIIVDQSRRLNDMITDALSRHADGPDVPVRPAPADVRELVERVAAAATMARGGEIVIDVGEERIVTDDRRLERVLLNLLDNALKYSPADQAVQVVGEGSADSYTFTVADAGPGVATEVVSALFTPFATDPTRAGGTGLGLHSAAGLVQELRGHISYTRQSGWTRFSVVLPRELGPPGGPRRGAPW